MKTIIGVIIGLALGITIGVTGDVLATPPPDQNSTEARLQALEYLMWTEQHAINYVSQRVWERASSCDLDYNRTYPCYNHDLILMPFTYAKDQHGYGPGNELEYLAQSVSAHGLWYARDNGDGDSWTVWVTLKIGENQYQPITWTVWQSNGFIRGVY
jgi:hypothetical protein